MAHIDVDPADEWSDFEVDDALDWLDAVEGPDGSARPSATFSTVGGAATAWRPNAHRGMLSCTFQPLLSNRTQKLISYIRAQRRTNIKILGVAIYNINKIRT
jgi:RIO kinase 1